MQTEPVVFENTVQSLLDAVGGRLTADARGALKEAGVDLGKPLLPAYPVALWTRMLHIISRAAFPDVAEDEAFRLLGREVVERWRKTLVGRAADAMARLVGPRRTLQRLSHHLRSSDNFCQTRFTPKGEREAELWVSEVLGMPRYYQGIVEHVVEGAGGRDVRVELLSQEGPACVFRVQWQ